MRQEVWTSLARLKEAGLSILVIDKNLDDLRAFADRHYVMDKGRIVWTGGAASFIAMVR